ncbi:MAG: glycosyltransferase [Proteobacteria bacterium]|nr:glycosyltransferase [Pseudomonadota bacterium]
MRNPPKSVCVLAPVHPYDDIRVFRKEAKSLARAGFRVQLIARADEALTEDGVEVLPLQYRHRWQRFPLQPWILWRVLQTGAPIVHLHNPDTLPIGFALKLLGRRVVYDTHENYRLLLLDKEWLPRLARRPLALAVDALERLAARVFDDFIVTQAAQVVHFGPRTTLIENPPITTGPLVAEARRLAEAATKEAFLRVCYVGLIKEDRGLFQMVEAMERLNQRHAARLWLIGRAASDDLIPRARALAGWRYVDYLGFLPSQAQAYAHILAADACLATFLPWGDNERVNINKFFEAGLFAKPVVASDFPIWRSYVEGVDCALFVDPQRPEAIAEALAWIAEHPVEACSLGVNGQRFVQERYNWELESGKLLAIYQRLWRSLGAEGV